MSGTATMSVGVGVPRRSLTLFVHVIIVAAAVWPFLLYQAAAGLVDLPNAIGRVGIGLRLLADPDSSPFYKLSFKLIPNMAVDTWGLFVGRFVGAEASVNLFVALSISVFYAGVQALRRALFGSSSLIIGALTVFVIYGLAFRWGFINYVFASGLMIWAVARLEFRLSRGGRAFIVTQTALLLVIYFSSLFPVVLYFGYACVRVAPRLLSALRSREWANAAIICIEHGVTLIPIGAAAVLGTAGAPWGNKSEWIWSSKVDAIEGLFWFQAELLEQLLGCVVAGLAACLAFPANARLRAGQAAALAALALLFLAVPFYLRGVAFADTRLPSTILGLMLGCLEIRPSSSWWTRAGGVTLAAACLMKPLAYTLQVWPLLQAAETLPILLQNVPEHSRMAIVAGAEGPIIGGQLAWHMPLIQLTRSDYAFAEIFPNYFIDLRAHRVGQQDGGLEDTVIQLDRGLACSDLMYVIVVGKLPALPPDLPADVTAAAGQLTLLRIRRVNSEHSC